MVMAIFAYQSAMRDKPMPRRPEGVPASPRPAPAGRGAPPRGKGRSHGRRGHHVTSEEDAARFVHAGDPWIAGAGCGVGSGALHDDLRIPACNTTDIPPVFAATGWKTVALDHIAFQVADPKKEAAFYVALMGWKVRSDDGTRVVMDIGDWGTVVFRQAPSGRRRQPVATRRARRGRGLRLRHRAVERKTVEAELRKRGLTRRRERRQGVRELPRERSRRLRPSDRQWQARSRCKTPSAAKVSARAIRADRVEDRVARPSLVRRRELQGQRVVLRNLLGWGATYDEGSQNELMIGDVGDIIIRGGNPLDPNFGQGDARGGRIDHISFGISPWDTDGVKAELEKRGLRPGRHSTQRTDGRPDEIHAAFKSYHTTRPTGTTCRSATSRTTTGWRSPMPSSPRKSQAGGRTGAASDYFDGGNERSRSSRRELKSSHRRSSPASNVDTSDSCARNCDSRARRPDRRLASSLRKS